MPKTVSTNAQEHHQRPRPEPFQAIPFPNPNDTIASDMRSDPSTSSAVAQKSKSKFASSQRSSILSSNPMPSIPSIQIDTPYEFAPCPQNPKPKQRKYETPAKAPKRKARPGRNKTKPPPRSSPLIPLQIRPQYLFAYSPTLRPQHRAPRATTTPLRAPGTSS